MEAIPRKYGEWGQFDRYCKLVLYHEAIDYLREMKCRRDREVSLDALSPADWDKLSTVDRYSCDSFTFSSHGYDLHIDNELVAEAFASLPPFDMPLNRIIIRDTLIPPPVLPAQAPININMTRIVREISGHPLKSVVAYPVVVMIEPTWKAAC